MTDERNLEDSAAAQFDTGRLHKGAEGCPVGRIGATFNPFAQSFFDDPYTFLKDARREEPIFYSPEIDHWVVTRYRDVKAVFENPAIFSAANALSAVTPMSPRVLQQLREQHFRMNPVLTNLDPPEHIRVRRHATNAFSSKRVAELEPWIVDLVDHFIDQLLAKNPDANGVRHADMVSEFAYDLPAHVAFHVLGVPNSEIANIKAWTKNRLMLTWGRCDEAAQLREVDGLIAMWKFCERHTAYMMERQDQSFMGDLVRHHLTNPADLSVNEIESILFTMLVAGHETTSNVLANSFVALLSDRKHWERLVAEPALIGTAVDELLRFCPSVISWRRITTQDTEIDGRAVPKGGRILLMLASANHDPEQFPEPETVDLARGNAKRNMSFGHGAHLCIGAGLARLQLKIVFERLTRQLPGLQIDEDQHLDYQPNLSFRGPSHVALHW